MSVHKPTFGHALRRVRGMQIGLIAMMVLVLASCSDLVFNPNQSRMGVLSLRPYFSAMSSEMLADVNIIHVTAKKLPEGTVVFDKEVTVDPLATDWSIPLELEPNAEYEITLVLVNRTNGLDVVVSSGRIDKLAVTTGPQPTPAPVPVYPGPPENLGVKSVTIAPRDQSVLEGDAVQLGVSIDGPNNATVQWISSNANVATVDVNGKVTTKVPGTTDITAIVGPKTDKITVSVGAKATQVELLPGTRTLVSFGEDATFTTRVLDTRNAVVTGLSASCNITDATIATQISPCVFRARKNGTTTITASAVQNGRTISATSSLTVGQKAVSVTVDPADAGTFDAWGGTTQFTAKAKDALGNDVTGLTFTWTSSDAAVATVDANGLATIIGNGSANIKAEITGASAQGKLTVQQRPATFVLNRDEVTLKSINETVQLTAQVKDSRGNVMNTPIIWQATMPLVASVDAKGLVTANGDGVTVVSAIAGTLRGNVQISVERVAARVRMLPADAQTINAGESKQYNAAIVDANGFALKTQSLTWRSSATSVASVSSTGLATGLSAGTTQISATGGGVTGTASLTVKGTTTGTLRVNRNGKVLILHADAADDIRTMLMGTGQFTQVDQMPMSGSIVPTTTMANYGAILVFTNYPPQYPVEHGDNLKAYVDAGGKVVLAVYAFSPHGSWDMRGGIMGAGYNPFSLCATAITAPTYYADCVLTTFPRSLNFTTALTSHPILAGVTDFTYDGNSNYTRVRLASGAVLVASDNEGVPLIAVNSAGTVAAFNLFPHYFSHSAGVDKALVNALK